jgi:RNA polymerase sigma-70 factor (ECF subfamily)
VEEKAAGREGLAAPATIIGQTRRPGDFMADDPVWREIGLREAVLAGDALAWRAWYDESVGRLETYVRWRCGGLDDLAEDVLQEVWLTAVRRIGDFDPRRGRFLAWLHGVAAHIIANQLRRRRAARLCPLEAEPAAAAGPSPAEEREHGERVARALATLTPRQEEALRAKYLDGMTVAEMAAAWGETPKAIESLLSRARQAFREAFGEPERTP